MEVVTGNHTSNILHRNLYFRKKKRFIVEKQTLGNIEGVWQQFVLM